jgi:hypothetical protein
VETQKSKENATVRGRTEKEETKRSEKTQRK